MNKYTQGFAIAVGMLLTSYSGGLAQTEVDPYTTSEQLQTMDQGVELMNQGKFAKADGYFLRVLENVRVVPADLCFYFGKNSYHLQKYQQSVDWLSKYIELKGTTGRFFDQAVEYRKLARADADTKPEPAVAEKKTKPQSRTLDCTQYPYVTCPVCNGQGVIVETGQLGTAVYKTCPYSDDSGRMSCTDYQKYLQGTLKSETGK